MAESLREWWVQKRKGLVSQHEDHLSLLRPSVFIPSVIESKDDKSIADERRAKAEHCTNEGVRAGAKAALVACIASAIPTLAAVRMVPWAKANLNYTGQSLIISAATVATYFIVAEQTILECSRDASMTALEKSRAAAS